MHSLARPHLSTAQTSAPKFALSLEAFGSRTAIIDEQGREISYETLARMADDASSRWGAERKLILMETANELEPLAIYLGALRAGHPIVLTASGEMSRNARLLDRFCPNIVVRNGSAGWVADIRSERFETAIHPELSLLLPTSGSTGEPKLVRLSQTNLDTNAGQIAEYLRLDRDRAITSLPWHYSYGLSVVHSYLASGCTLVLTSSSIGDLRYIDEFERHRCTSFAGVPYSFEILERSGFLERAPPSALRYFTVAGGRLPPEKVKMFALWAERHGVQFYVMYGQTEASPRIAYLPPSLAVRHPDSIGVPVPGGVLSIQDEQGQNVTQPDRVGELVYRGPNVMMGYAQLPADLARGAELAELRTGDLASCNSSGLFRITGRASRFSKLFGLRVNLDDIEDQLAKHDISSRVAGDDSLIAIMFRASADQSEVEATVAQLLGLPRSIIVALPCPDFPQLPSGKTDYAAVLSSGKRHQSARQEAPEDAEARGLARRLAHVLGRQYLDPNSSYVELSGDSLTYVQASIVVEDELGNLPDEWEKISVSELERLAKERSLSSAKHLFSFRTVESSVLLRALAILGVVVAHVRWPEIAGGAYLLLTLSGMLFARLRRDRLVSGHILAAALPPLGRILAAYFVVLLAYQLGRGHVDILHWLLIANFSPALQSEHTLLPYYWFIPNFVQTVLLYAGLFAVPAYRRAAGDRPWEIGLATLGGGFALCILGHFTLSQLGVEQIMTRGHFTARTPMFLFYLFAFGWCLEFANSNRRRLLLSGASIAMFPAIGVTEYAAWLICGTLFALWVPRTLVPGILRGAVVAVAGAAFYIFIAHMIPVQVYRNLPDPGPILTVGTVVLAILAGIGLGWAIRNAELFARRFMALKPLHTT